MTNFVATKFNTPIGRMVFGDVYDPETEDFDGNPLVIKNGVDKGKPTVRYNIGLAVPKAPGETHWANSPLGAIIWAQGHRDHAASATRDDFAWKVTDGDSAKPGKPYKGKPSKAPKDKAGFPGNWVFAFGGSNEPKILTADISSYILEKGVVQNGDSIQIVGDVVGNTGATPGVYLNYRGIIWHGMHRDGRIMSNGIDLDELRKSLAGQTLPAFVVVGSVPTGTPAAPATGAPPAPAVNAGAPPPPPATTVQQVPQMPVTPAAGFIPVTGAGAPPPPPNGATAVPPPPPSGPQMTAKANGNSYASFIAGGWTDAALRANGYMV